MNLCRTFQKGLSRRSISWIPVAAPVLIFSLLLPGLRPALASMENQPPEELRQAFQAMVKLQYEEAETLFLKAMDIAPGYKEARFGLGTLYIKTREYENALDLLEALMAEYPNDYFIKNNVAWVYATAEDYSIRDGERAVRLAQDALLSQPGSYHVWSTLSEGYYVIADYEKALRAAEQALRLGQANGASSENMEAYRDQLRKCARARQALSLIE